MSQSDDAKADEIVIRGLIRLPDEMTGPFARPSKDANDFIRRERYLSTGLPENGLSVFRKSKFKSSQEIYDRIGSKKLMGIAECQLGELTAMGLKYKVTGERQEHISLRCSDCDMVELSSGICKPTTGIDFRECPFFGPDHFDLNGMFKEVEPPAIRNVKKSR